MFKQRPLMLVICALYAASLFAATPAATTKPAAKPAASRSDAILPFHASEKTLPNGLKVIVVPTGFPNVVSVYITMQTGSRNEIEPGKSGFAHFFEHVMFRGTEKYPPEKYNAVIQKAGARQNANTSDDRTIFHETFAKSDLPKILEIEADRFENLSYPESIFKTEARAVLGEYNKNSANPIRKILEVQREAAFNTHTYKHTTMGFIKDVEDMPNQYQYSKEFFRRWYRPEYATVVIAGDVNADDAFKLVEKYFGNWKHGSYKATIPQEPAQPHPIYAHVDWTQTLPWITVAYRVPGFDENSFALPALDTALDLEFGDTSDLHKRLVEDEQKVDRLFYFNDAHVDPSLYTVFARVKDAKDAIYVRDRILAAFAKLRNQPEPADRVEQAKSNARYSFVRSLDNTEAITETVAEWAKFRRSYDTVNNYYRELARVTPKEIQDAAKKTFTDSGVVITTLSHDPLPAGIETAPSLASFALNAAPAFAAASDLRIITQKSVLPQVEIKLLFNTGSANDPAGKEGLAFLSAMMITDAGSKQLRIDQINKALYPMAGSFYSQVDKDMTTITGSIHKDNWKKFFEIVLPQLLAPGLRDDDFQRIKDSQLNALRQDLRNANEEELGKEELMNRIYAGTPYGHTVLGTVAGIQSITLDDIRKFIADNYTRGNVVIGISGDYPSDLVTTLKSELAALPQGAEVAGGKVSLPPVAGQTANGLNVEIIEKDTRATAISMGMPIPVTREHPDFAALNVARAWLGEHRASTGRLYQRLREIRGLNYGDYAYIEFFTRPGSQFFPAANIARRAQAFELWIRPVVPANAQMSIRLALYELNKLVTNGMSQEDFESTRDYLSKNVYLMTATQDARLGYALDSWWFGIPEYTDYMRAQYAKLTRDDVNNALKKYLSAQNLQVVIVTKDAQGLADLLTKDEPSQIKYDSEKPADIMAEDKVIGAYKLAVRPENVHIVKADEIFAK